MSLLYFAYGSNMHPGRLRHRIGLAIPQDVARLDHHRLAFHKRGADGSGKGDVVVAVDAEVWGVLYAVDHQHAQLLDHVEGAGYSRVEVRVVRQSDGQPTRAFCYRALAAAIEDGLAPFHWYLDFVLHGALHHGLPARYTDWLRSIPVADDPDVERTRRERALLRQR
jgi:gamma-glutamylcyclotransferase